MSNPFLYTDRTYNTILQSINNVPQLADKPEWFKRLIAGLGDTNSVIIDAVANDSLLPSALTRSSTQALLKLIDYELGLTSTSSGIQIFNVSATTPSPTTFSTLDLLASTQGSLAVSTLRYQSRSGVTYTLSQDDFTRTSSIVFTTAKDYNFSGKKVQLATTGTLPAGLSTGTDYFIIYIDSTSFSLASSLENAFNNIPVNTTDAGTGTHTVNLYAFEATLFQQESVAQFAAGDSDGTTSFQEIDLPDINIIPATIQVTIASVNYNQVTTLVESSGTDPVYRVLTKTDGRISLLFGNGTYGIIPPAAEIFVSYSYGGGTISNQSVINSINTYAGSNTLIETTANVTTFTGGANEQSIADAKILGPLLLKARNRFVTVEDGEVLALALGGISLINIIRNFFGVLSVNVLGIANGGGGIGTAKKNEVQTELTDRSILESIRVVVSDPDFLAQTVNCNIKRLSIIDFPTLSARVNFGIRLFFSETGKEINDNYIANGISSTITLINVIFSENFSNLDTSWLESLVQNLTYANFGNSIDESDIVAYLKSNITGIDDISFTAPSFPIEVTNVQITTHTGTTITINEVT